MIRREARLRREYLYRKSIEEKERSLYEKKLALKTALEEGKPLTKEERLESQRLAKEVVFDPNIYVPSTHVDDEYANASLREPKVVVTTSRDPSSKLHQFAKEVRLLFPNAQRINRGNHVMKQLADTCKANEVTDLIILHEHRGIPDGMIITHFPHGPTAYFSLFNVILRHDLPERESMSEAYPHLIFEKFDSKLGNRAKNILKHLFPIPKPDSQRVMTFANDSDFISFRHHTFKRTGHKKVELQEIGPRFEMRLYEIRLGTVDMQEADKEWVLRPYMNSSKKRDVL